MLLALFTSPVDAADTPSAKPNVIFYLTDDMGWADPSCYGNTEVKTPNIDRLAAEGVRFMQFYCASPICSPSRAGFTTGMFPARWNITDYLHDRAGNRRSECADWLDLKAPTLARALQQAGYATAHIGKWHMGGGRDVNDAPWPKEYGFDESWTTWEGMGPRIEKDFPGIKPYERTEKFVNKAIDFIKRHKDRPFYVNVWPNEAGKTAVLGVWPQSGFSQTACRRSQPQRRHARRQMEAAYQRQRHRHTTL